MQHEVNCRNFKCANNKEGDCLSARLEFTPDGSLMVNRLRCVQYEEREPESPPRTEPEPIPDQ